MKMQGVVEYDISPVRGPLANAFLMLINALFFNVKLIGLEDIYPKDMSRMLLNVSKHSFLNNDIVEKIFYWMDLFESSSDQRWDTKTIKKLNFVS